MKIVHDPSKDSCQDFTARIIDSMHRDPAMDEWMRNEHERTISRSGVPDDLEQIRNDLASYGD